MSLEIATDAIIDVSLSGDTVSDPSVSHYQCGQFPDQLCRLCGTMQAGMVLPLFDAIGGKGSALVVMVRKCLPSVSLKDATELPRNVCFPCVARIKEMWTYSQRVFTVQIRLEKVLRGEEAVFVADDVAQESEYGNLLHTEDEGLLELKCEVNISEEAPKTDGSGVLTECSYVELNGSAPEKSEFESVRRRTKRKRERPETPKPKPPPAKRGRPKKFLTSEAPVLLPPLPLATSLETEETDPEDYLEEDDLKDDEEDDDDASSSPGSGPDEGDDLLGKELSGADVDPKLNTILHCFMCNASHANFRTLRSHFEQIHPGEKVQVKCEICGAAIEDSTKWKDHKRHHRRMNKKYECPLCHKLYPRRTLKRHMIVHAGVKDHNCIKCGKSFYTTGELRQHEKKVHEGWGQGLKTMCELCGKQFSYKGNLASHMRTHTGEKPYQCKYCDKRFAQKGNLDEHERMHTQEKPYFCEVCGAQFLRQNTLKMHSRIHTNQRPYKCDVCPKAFKRLQTLKKHQRYHLDLRPHPCSYCGKRFRDKEKLKIHVRIHTGERPYTCSVCGRGFYDKGNMHKHERVHRGVNAQAYQEGGSEGFPSDLMLVLDKREHSDAVGGAYSMECSAGGEASQSPSSHYLSPMSSQADTESDIAGYADLEQKAVHQAAFSLWAAAATIQQGGGDSQKNPFLPQV